MNKNKLTYRVRFNVDLGEYRVTFFVDGKRRPDADYFTDDPYDAHETGKAEVERWNLANELEAKMEAKR